MKKINIIAICLILASLVSCDLDRFPSNAIDKDQAFKTVKDATSFNNGMYVYLRDRAYGYFNYYSDYQSDLLNAMLDFGNRGGSNYSWTFLSDDYAFRDVWANYYSAITNVNNYLDNEAKIVGTTTDETTKLKSFKGEAHFFRAYYYHQLIKLYAKDYEPGSAATDLGVPLVLVFDVNAKPARATVEQVYTQILADLAIAKENISAQGTVGSTRVTKDCVSALEARVYLCMHKYTEAAAAVDAIIGRYPLAATAAAFKDMWQKDVTTESILQLIASKPSELIANTYSVYLNYSASTTSYAPDFIPEQWVVDLYAAADYRKAAYLEVKPIKVGGVNYNLYAMNKYPGNPELFTAAVTNYQHKPKILRIGEMHIIKAEALASKGDDAGALTALNVLRAGRGLSALTGLTGSALLNEIRNERTRELLCEGTRLDDLKRWKLPMVRKAPQNAQAIIGDQAANNLNVPAGDSKFVWAIPINDMTTNPNLMQNPGWN